MKKVTPHDRIQFLQRAEAYLEMLEHTDRVMFFSDFARAIGAWPANRAWCGDHAAKETSDTLKRLSEMGFDLAFGRIVNKATGKPGKGFHKTFKLKAA